MSQQLIKPTGTIKKTKKPLPLSPLLAKAKSKKPLIINSHSPTNTTCPPSFCLTSPSPSLRWRPKPSIKNCYHTNTEHAGPSCATNMLDTAAFDAISSQQYDRLRASLHSTILPAVVPKGNQALKKPHKLMMASKSVPAKQTTDTSSHKGSAQSVSTHAKRRYWVPTPTEMATIGDKIPKAFVKTSLTGRKTVAIPTDTRTWLRGNLSPIESSPSVTDHQVHLVRGGRLLNKKPKKKDRKSPPPPPPPTAATSKNPSKSKLKSLPKSTSKSPPKSTSKSAPSKSLPKSTSKSPTKLPPKSSSNSPPKLSPPKSHSKSQPKCPSKPSKKSLPVAAAKKTRKSAKNDPLPNTAAPPKTTKKMKDISSKTSGEKTRTHRRRERYSKPLELDTVYINTASQSRLHSKVTDSTHSLPPPFTPTEDLKPEPIKTMPAAVSLGLSAFVECFYCRVRYPIDDLRAHQDECCKELLKRRAHETKSPLDLVQDRFENSFHKLNFDGSSCSLLDYDSRPAFIEEGGLLSALPSKVSSNDALNQTCWYCGWDYSPEIAERHMADCAAVRGNVRPTAEGKKLRRLVERKIKAYGRYNPRRKNLWV